MMKRAAAPTTHQILINPTTAPATAAAWLQASTPHLLVAHQAIVISPQQAVFGLHGPAAAPMFVLPSMAMPPLALPCDAAAAAAAVAAGVVAAPPLSRGHHAGLPPLPQQQPAAAAHAGAHHSGGALLPHRKRARDAAGGEDDYAVRALVFVCARLHAPGVALTAL